MPFQFLDLPGEIRNKIYEFALLPYKNRIHACHNARFPKKGCMNYYPAVESDHLDAGHCFNPNLALFLVNRQIHDEAGSLFWDQALFVLNPAHCHAKSRVCGENCVEKVYEACGRRIQRIEFYIIGYEDSPLKRCTQWSWNAKQVSFRRIDQIAYALFKALHYQYSLM